VKSLALIHTVAGLIPTFDELIRKHLPEWQPFNIVDESLLRNTIRDGHLTAATARRVAAYIWSAADAGADAILVTCSSIGAAVDAAQPLCAVPLVRVDEGMVEEAIRLGNRIGVVATLSTTLDPTRDLLARHAMAAGRVIAVEARICAGAFAALSRGDRAEHDNIVRTEIAALAADVDVIVLAQASMARALTGPDAPRIAIPMLSSPELGVRTLRERVVASAWLGRANLCNQTGSGPTLTSA
jgi:Asp/Glu/hydantoin racemase